MQIDDLVLAYWVAANLNDTKRMFQISDNARFALGQITSQETSTATSFRQHGFRQKNHNFPNLWSKSSVCAMLIY